MKKFIIILSLVAFYLTSPFAQLKIREDGRLNLAYGTATFGANAALYLGSYIYPDHPGVDNGLFTFEVLSDGMLNVCRAWLNRNWEKLSYLH